MSANFSCQEIQFYVSMAAFQIASYTNILLEEIIWLMQQLFFKNYVLAFSSDFKWQMSIQFVNISYPTSFFTKSCNCYFFILKAVGWTSV